MTEGDHWFEPIADHLGSAYLRYSFTKGTDNEVDAVLALSGLASPARVLDVGCGPGRHSLALAARGFEVTGIDISRRFVDLANRAAADQGLGHLASFRRHDARRLRFDAEFDLVLSLCQGAFGLTGGPGSVSPPSGPELDESVLTGLARALRPGGVLVLSAFSAYFQVRYLEEGDRFDAATGVNRETTSVLDPDGVGAEVDLWTTCYTPRELRLLARLVGLEPLAIHGVTPGRYRDQPPGIDCPEFLLVARRATAASL